MPAQVLDDIRRLRDHMRTSTTPPVPDETIRPWHVRETLLETARYAASMLGRYEDALAFNAEVIDSQRARQAPTADIYRVAYSDSIPLLRLGRTSEALRLLLDCRQVFQDTHDVEMLGRVLIMLSEIKDARGHGDAAIRLVLDGLRYRYLAVDIIGIAGIYHSLGTYLAIHARQASSAFSSHLIAAWCNCGNVVIRKRIGRVSADAGSAAPQSCGKTSNAQRAPAPLAIFAS